MSGIVDPCESLILDALFYPLPVGRGKDLVVASPEQFDGDINAAELGFVLCCVGLAQLAVLAIEGRLTFVPEPRG
jgi:hypothetical protein